MKKLISMIIGLVLLVLLIGGIYILATGTAPNTGIYLAAENGSHIIVLDSSPIIMSAKDKEQLFAGLESGDKILILHGAIRETFPGGTDVRFCLKLPSSEPVSTPPGLIQQLEDLGYKIK